jgi:hypothetical protein
LAAPWLAYKKTFKMRYFPDFLDLSYAQESDLKLSKALKCAARRIEKFSKNAQKIPRFKPF